MAAAWAQCSTCETGETAESQRFEARTSMRCTELLRIIQIRIYQTEKLATSCNHMRHC